MTQNQNQMNNNQLFFYKLVFFEEKQQVPKVNTIPVMAPGVNGTTLCITGRFLLNEALTVVSNLQFACPVSSIASYQHLEFIDHLKPHTQQQK